jgi:hypothetical protein
MAGEDRPDTCSTSGIEECLNFAQYGGTTGNLRHDTDLHVIDEECSVLRMQEFLKSGENLNSIDRFHNGSA